MLTFHSISAGLFTKRFNEKKHRQKMAEDLQLFHELQELETPDQKKLNETNFALFWASVACTVVCLTCAIFFFVKNYKNEKN